MVLMYSLAADHVERIIRLQQPSIISIVSVSESVLRTARSLFASAIRKEHVLHEVLMTDPVVPNSIDCDLAFCDTVTLNMVQSRNKVHYQLIAKDCLSDLAASLS